MAEYTLNDCPIFWDQLTYATPYHKPGRVTAGITLCIGQLSRQNFPARNGSLFTAALHKAHGCKTHGRVLNPPILPLHALHEIFWLADSDPHRYGHFSA
jgi:hypothetical protein